MDAREAARLEHERRRWLRPGWERWLRSDWENFVQPAHRERMRQEREAFEQELLELRWELKKLKLDWTSIT